MSKILSGTALKNAKIPEQKRRIEALKKHGVVPKLCIVTVGDDQASQVYVRNKKRLAEELGIKIYHKLLPKDCSQDRLNVVMHNIACVYQSVILQLPLPIGLNADEAIRWVPSFADVDGFQPGSPYIQCTAGGIVELLYSVHPSLTGKNVVVIGRSEKVGLPISLALLRENMTVSICHSKTPSEELRHLMMRADVVVSCVGKAKLFSWRMVNPSCTIIDVGMNHDENGKLCGDFDMDGIELSPGRTYTPVPGGVGPMTVSCLMDNVIEAAERSVRL